MYLLVFSMTYSYRKLNIKTNKSTLSINNTFDPQKCIYGPGELRNLIYVNYTQVG